MQEQVLKRIHELIAQGAQVTRRDRGDYWVDDIVSGQAWMASAINAILQVAPPQSFYVAEVTRLSTQDELKSGISFNILEKVLGVLKSVEAEAQTGLLAKLELQVFVTAFDEFLDHATFFHRAGKVKESAVLVSVVLEDTIKRIAAKNTIPSEGVTLDPLIDLLTKASIFTPVKAKRIKAFAGVRNHALHAEWEKIDIKDVGSAIEGTRELLDSYL